MQIFDEDSCDLCELNHRTRKQIDRFDRELVERAEIFSDKWVQLFQNSTQIDDKNVSQIIGTTAIGAHHINRFIVDNSIVNRLNPHPDSIIEQNKLILLDRKYFEFETSTNDDAEIGTTDSNRRDDIEKYTTVFDDDDDTDSIAQPPDQVNEMVKPKLTNEKIAKKPEAKASKKKKGRTKYRPLNFDDAGTTSTANKRASAVLAAPPGVKALQSPLISPRRMDLSKNGNYSLQFRL